MGAVVGVLGGVVFAPLPLAQISFDWPGRNPRMVLFESP